MISTVTMLLSILTILGQTAVLGLLIALLLKPANPYRQFVFRLLSPRLLALGFAVALFATLGSLFYSDIAGYTPCKLCWYQRIFMYPQTILFGIALWKKDTGVWVYSIALSAAGGILAIYHYYLQLGGNPLIPCATVGYSAACSQRFVLEYGYITIPLMAATAFLFLILLGVMAKKKAL